MEYLWPILGLLCQVFCQSRKLLRGGNLWMVERLNFFFIGFCELPIQWVYKHSLACHEYFLCVRLLYTREQVERSREGAFSSVGSLLCILVHSNPLTHEPELQHESLNFLLVLHHSDRAMMDSIWNGYDKLSVIFDKLCIKILSHLYEVA